MSEDVTRVLGVDLACRSWGDNGTAVVEFTSAQWLGCTVRPFGWPEGPITSDDMAATIHAFAQENRVAAVCLDGPQGWREPGVGPGDRPGVGRLAEYDVRAQGKVGEYGRTYPRNQAPWIEFCIAVFDRLLGLPGVVLANAPDAGRIDPPKGGYLLAEVFPTSIWRASGLHPLPGKRRTTQERMADARRLLAARYGMPDGFVPSQGSHDDLQAVVAALPGVGLLGGPAVPQPNGKAAFPVAEAGEAPAHRAEGLIWDARPAWPGEIPPEAAAPLAPPAPGDGGNPLLPDDRDEFGDEVLDRGVRLFRHLVELTRGGDAAGVGYADFAIAAYGATAFTDIAGRSYKPSDSGWVVELADQVTAAAGGAVEVSYGGATILVGMDSLVWPTRPPHDLSDRAFDDHLPKYGYTREQWRAVFPDGARRVVTVEEALSAANSTRVGRTLREA